MNKMLSLGKASVCEIGAVGIHVTTELFVQGISDIAASTNDQYLPQKLFLIKRKFYHLGRDGIFPNLYMDAAAYIGKNSGHIS